jgi:hypothetical protein
VLTPANVNSTKFGKLFSYSIDATSHASPLYVANVNIPGLGPRNVVYVVTERDTIYAFDADGRNASPFWQVSFINPGSAVTTVPPSDTGEVGDIAPVIGITSTTVIDPATSTIYVVAKTKEVSGSTTRHRLNALDLATGAEKFGGPVIIQASVPGTGAGSCGGNVQFNSLRHNQRPALIEQWNPLPRVCEPRRSTALSRLGTRLQRDHSTADDLRQSDCRVASGKAAWDPRPIPPGTSMSRLATVASTQLREGLSTATQF